MNKIRRIKIRPYYTNIIEFASHDHIKVSNFSSHYEFLQKANLLNKSGFIFNDFEYNTILLCDDSQITDLEGVLYTAGLKSDKIRGGTNNRIDFIDNNFYINTRNLLVSFNSYQDIKDFVKLIDDYKENLKNIKVFTFLKKNKLKYE